MRSTDSAARLELKLRFERLRINYRKDGKRFK
jgi:hypothetical protein